MMKIENLNFSVRTYNILKRARIDTKEQLEQMSDDELMCVRNLGKHSLDEIHEKLERYTMTNGDRIRAMTDEELAKWMYENEADAKIPYCVNSEECGALLDNGIYPTKEMCIRCLCNFIKQPAEVDHDTN